MPRLDPNSTRSPYEEMLEAIRAHIEKHGHRRFFSVQWRVAERIGFTCEDCEERDVEFTVTLDRVALVRDPRAYEFVGGGKRRDAFVAWLESVASPHDHLREPPMNAWQHLLEDEHE